MKLLSTQRNTYGKQLICDDAVFDSSLMSITHIDITEKVVTFKYDFSECGHPLNLPFEAHNVDFLLKLTKHDIHICALVGLNNEIYDDFEEFVNDLGDVEFDVRMTTDEKFALLLAILYALLNKTKMKTKEHGQAAENEKKEYFDGEQSMLNVLKDIFKI